MERWQHWQCYCSCSAVFSAGFWLFCKLCTDCPSAAGTGDLSELSTTLLGYKTCAGCLRICPSPYRRLFSPGLSPLYLDSQYRQTVLSGTRVMPRYFGQGQLIDICGNSEFPISGKHPGCTVWAAVSAVQCLLWASTMGRNAGGQVEQKAPLSFQWAGTHAWRSSDKDRRRPKVSLVELEKSRGERVARQPVTQEVWAVVMVGATRTSWSVLQVSRAIFGRGFARFCNFWHCGSHRFAAVPSMM